MFGFVYIWLDASNGMFYIGSHKGHVKDGYVGSGKYFKTAYKLRPEKFKRRILEIVHEPDYNLLMEREEHWLSFIDEKELGKKYYNLTKLAKGHTQTDETKRKLKRKHSDEENKRKSERQKGRKFSESHLAKLKISSKTRIVSDAWRKSHSENMKNKPSNRKGKYGPNKNPYDSSSRIGKKRGPYKKKSQTNSHIPPEQAYCCDPNVESSCSSILNNVQSIAGKSASFFSYSSLEIG